MRLILPTSDILKEFRSREEWFDFYEEGLRGIVKGIIAYHDGSDNTGLTQVYQRPNVTERFIDNVMMLYAESTDHRVADIMENDQKIFLIELSVEMIDDTVREMMMALFSTVRYRINPETAFWMGNDLVVDVYRLV